MTSIFIPAGQALTVVTVSAGSYWQQEPGSEPTGNAALSANATTVIGPFNDNRHYHVVSNNTDHTYSLANDGVFTGTEQNATYAPTASPTFTGFATLPKGSPATEASNAVTLNGQSGVITTSSLSVAAGGNYIITLTNSAIVGTGSIILCQYANGTNTNNNITIKARCSAASTALITIYNDVAAVTAISGTVIINFLVI